MKFSSVAVGALSVHSAIAAFTAERYFTVALQGLGESAAPTAQIQSGSYPDVTGAKAVSVLAWRN